MNVADAGRAVAVLNACFIDTALEPESVAVWVDEIARLQNPDAAIEAARMCGRNGDRFPTMRQYLAVYRGVAERMKPPAPELEAVTSGERELPESVREWLDRGPREL